MHYYISWKENDQDHSKSNAVMTRDLQHVLMIPVCILQMVNLRGSGLFYVPLSPVAVDGRCETDVVQSMNEEYNA